MAKTSKNKMKLWRRMAEDINLDEGQKHQGRKFKNSYQMPAAPTGLLLALLTSIGMVFEQNNLEALATGDSVITLDGQTRQLPTLS